MEQCVDRKRLVNKNIVENVIQYHYHLHYDMVKIYILQKHICYYLLRVGGENNRRDKNQNVLNKNACKITHSFHV